MKGIRVSATWVCSLGARHIHAVVRTWARSSNACPLRAVALLATFGIGAPTADATAQIPDGMTPREWVEEASFGPIHFEQPRPGRYDVDGVTVLFLEDRELPLVTAMAGFEGGFGRFPRSHYAAATALPALLRYGGVDGMPPDSVDIELETYAIQLSFGTGGAAVSSSMNVLTEHFGRGMTLWGRMLAEPAFDASEVEIWRGRQLESILRRPDDPASLAFTQFNRLLYGDHPIGWEMDASDLHPSVMSPARLREVHTRIVCRRNLLLGITGDVSWSEARPMVAEFVARVPTCDDPLPEAPIPEVQPRPGVHLIHKELDQAVIVLAHPTDLPLDDDPEYFSATIGNTILGGGGFSSRIMDRVRSERGYAYSASSLWTTPRRYPGLLGAVTRTQPETVVPAIEVILETMHGMAAEAPSDEEVRTTVDRIVNGFVFNFDSPAQIVSRSMFYMAQELPEDWLERYMAGVQAVNAEDVASVFRKHLRRQEMSILIVGDTARVGVEALERLGPVRMLPTP